MAELDPATLRALPGRRAQVGVPGVAAWSFGVEGLTIVDLITGEVVHRRQALPWFLLERSSLDG